MVTVVKNATFQFADDTKRTVSVSPFNSETETEEFRDNVKILRRWLLTDEEIPVEGEQVEAFKQNFLSNDGAQCKDIVAASIVVTEKTAIYAKTAADMIRALKETDDDGNTNG